KEYLDAKTALRDWKYRYPRKIVNPNPAKSPTAFNHNLCLLPLFNASEYLIVEKLIIAYSGRKLLGNIQCKQSSILLRTKYKGFTTPDLIS
ncbi:4302_t:CDS:1, partial [Acaulospora morrowiae]